MRSLYDLGTLVFRSNIHPTGSRLLFFFFLGSSSSYMAQDGVEEHKAQDTVGGEKEKKRERESEVHK